MSDTPPVTPLPFGYNGTTPWPDGLFAAASPRWRRSSRCEVNGSCVEAASLGASVAVRDAHGSRIDVPASAWRDLLAAVRSGDMEAGDA